MEEEEEEESLFIRLTSWLKSKQAEDQISREAKAMACRGVDSGVCLYLPSSSVMNIPEDRQWAIVASRLHFAVI